MILLGINLNPNVSVFSYDEIQIGLICISIYYLFHDVGG